MTAEWTFKAADVAIIVAAVAGPIFAVQAQKWLERGREIHQRRFWIFRTLMATRASILSLNHVEALNAVSITEALRVMGVDEKEHDFEGATYFA